MRAEAVWGPAYCIAEIPCCDLNGDVVAYMFVYQYGPGQAKTDKEIRDTVKQGRKDYDKAAKELAQAQKKLAQKDDAATVD